MRDLASIIRDELEAFSADLLETGIAPSNASLVAGAPGSNKTWIVHSINSLASLIPRLLAELESSDEPHRYVESVTYVPVGASLSKRPADYRLHGDILLPKRWVRMVPMPAANQRPLRWLLHLLERQEELLDEMNHRTQKRVEDAMVAKRGASRWAQDDKDSLLGMIEDLRQVRSTLQRALQSVRNLARPQPVASPLLPSPYPSSQAWFALRRIAHQYLDPKNRAALQVSDLLGRHGETANLPHLYQRWCAVKIVETLRDLGWRDEDDPVDAIFLGGKIAFRNGGHGFELWIEPRLTRRGHHASGFQCCVGEDLTPDFLFVTPGPGSPDAFVLDATMITVSEHLKEKGRYLDTIELQNLVPMAGYPVRRFPKLSWAAAPIAHPHVKHLERDGRKGVIPMHPIRWSNAPLRAWLQEVTRHALAWSLVQGPHTRRRPHS